MGNRPATGPGIDGELRVGKRRYIPCLSWKAGKPDRGGRWGGIRNMRSCRSTSGLSQVGRSRRRRRVRCNWAGGALVGDRMPSGKERTRRWWMRPTGCWNRWRLGAPGWPGDGAEAAEDGGRPAEAVVWVSAPLRGFEVDGLSGVLGAPPSFCPWGDGGAPAGSHALLPVAAHRGDGRVRAASQRLDPLEGRGHRAGKGMLGRGRGVVIWASGPKPGVGAAGESVLEGLRGPQAGWGRGGRVGGPRGSGLPVRRR